jgi:hypothetical protein
MRIVGSHADSKARILRTTTFSAAWLSRQYAATRPVQTPTRPSSVLLSPTGLSDERPFNPGGCLRIRGLNPVSNPVSCKCLGGTRHIGECFVVEHCAVVETVRGATQSAAFFLSALHPVSSPALHAFSSKCTACALSFGPPHPFANMFPRSTHAVISPL